MTQFVDTQDGTADLEADGKEEDNKEYEDDKTEDTDSTFRKT
jgi:hypothetical protein